MAVIAARPPVFEKWTLFWFSLLLPGLGQLVARSLWCVPWFAGVVCYWCIVNAGVFGSTVSAGVVLQVSSVLLALLSAEHAKRLMEPSGSARTGQSKPRSRIRCTHVGHAVIELKIELLLDRPVGQLWSEVSDVKRFLCIDPLHERVIVQTAVLQPGVDLVLVHCVFGYRFLRFGKLLTWRDGCGYSFSDLSARGKRNGFPHVFFVSVEPLAGEALHRSRLSIRVLGKWTSSWIPCWLWMWWLRYVSYEHARLLRNTL